MSELDAITIVEYAEHSMNASAVAADNYWHKSTVNYHLEKVKEKTGLNPKNFFDLHKLYIMAQAVLNPESKEVLI